MAAERKNSLDMGGLSTCSWEPDVPRMLRTGKLGVETLGWLCLFSKQLQTAVQQEDKDLSGKALHSKSGPQSK